MMQKLKDLPFHFPVLASIVMGVISAYAMAPATFWPALLIGFSMMVLIMGKLTNPWKGAWCVFAYGMAYFTISLWWVANALMIDIETYWWAMGFAILGLPLLLSLLWFVCGWVVVRFSRPESFHRAIFFISLLALAEYGRAFNLTGFPWNLMGYAWINVPALPQLSALGGAYFVTIVTLYWMAVPAFMVYARGNKKLRIGIMAALVVSVGGSFAYGGMRLSNHPTTYRKDTVAVIVQPNVRPEDKMENTNREAIFAMQVALSEKGLKEVVATPELETVTVVWPETALDESLVDAIPDVSKALAGMMSGKPYKIELVTGMWREGAPKADGRPSYYNSIALVGEKDGKVTIDDMYDKHHLVPFGEFLPMEQTLGLTPLVGFAGFAWGTGPKVLSTPGVPPVSPMICFEAIFPWYGKSEGAEWLVNTSNDGWYGDTPGPYQHLAMTQYRAIEQGKPIMRSATTGISAVIDSYGRVLKGLPYYEQGYIVSEFPQDIQGGTMYTRFGESLFFLTIGLGLAVFLRLKQRKI